MGKDTHERMQRRERTHKERVERKIFLQCAMCWADRENNYELKFRRPSLGVPAFRPTGHFHLFSPASGCGLHHHIYYCFTCRGVYHQRPDDGLPLMYMYSLKEIPPGG